jgi:hypothetical protein
VRKVTYRDPDGNEIGFGGGLVAGSAFAGARPAAEQDGRRVEYVKPVRVDRSASRLRPRLVGLAARSSATFDVTGDGRGSRLSVERDDDLAVGAALLDVGQRLEGLVKWEGRVDDRAEVAGVVEGGQLTQLGAVGLHEQERVAHT